MHVTMLDGKRCIIKDDVSKYDTRATGNTCAEDKFIVRFRDLDIDDQQGEEIALAFSHRDIRFVAEWFRDITETLDHSADLREARKRAEISSAFG